jgi:hypothetical protein
MAKEGYWKSGAWFEPTSEFKQKIEVIQTNPFDTVVKLNGEPLRLVSYMVSHHAREMPMISLQLSGMTQLDITENEGEMYIIYKDMKFKRVE